ncbi:MAG TPA: hypothetical protein VGN07_01495 [Steroidobacteraceae bacterium]|jgi:hypothetical protein
MVALPAHVHESINRDPRNARVGHIEDIHVSYGGAHFWFSVEIEHRLDAAGNRVLGQIRYQGKNIELPEPFRDLFEQVLECRK